MPDPARLAQRALEHIRVLAGEIGPRPAGSPAELSAFDYIEKQLIGWGYRVMRQPAAFAELPPFSYPYLIGGLALLLGGWGIRAYPWLVIGLPVLFMTLPQWARWSLLRRARTQQSVNLFAELDGQPVPRTQTGPFILCSHVDSARVNPLRSTFLLKLYGRSMDILQRICMMVAALALLELIGMGPSDILVIPVAILGSLGGAWVLGLQGLDYAQYRTLDHAHPDDEMYSPGANDNASGVGVLLALAEHYATQGSEGRKIGFLFTTAEETGLHGAVAFAAENPHFRERAVFLCLDMVGIGNKLYYVTKDGIISPLHTDVKLNLRLQAAYPPAKPLWYTLKSGDHAAFLREDFTASALQTGGGKQADITYHTAYDTVDAIEQPALKMTLETVLALISQPMGG